MADSSERVNHEQREEKSRSLLKLPTEVQLLIIRELFVLEIPMPEIGSTDSVYKANCIPVCPFSTLDRSCRSLAILATCRELFANTVNEARNRAVLEIRMTPTQACFLDNSVVSRHQLGFSELFAIHRVRRSLYQQIHLTIEPAPDKLSTGILLRKLAPIFKGRKVTVCIHPSQAEQTYQINKIQLRTWFYPIRCFSISFTGISSVEWFDLATHICSDKAPEDLPAIQRSCAQRHGEVPDGSVTYESAMLLAMRRFDQAAFLRARLSFAIETFEVIKLCRDRCKPRRKWLWCSWKLVPTSSGRTGLQSSSSGARVLSLLEPRGTA